MSRVHSYKSLKEIITYLKDMKSNNRDFNLNLPFVLEKVNILIILKRLIKTVF